MLYLCIFFNSRTYRQFPQEENTTKSKKTLWVYVAFSLKILNSTFQVKTISRHCQINIFLPSSPRESSFYVRRRSGLKAPSLPRCSNPTPSHPPHQPLRAPASPPANLIQLCVKWVRSAQKGKCYLWQEAPPCSLTLAVITKNRPSFTGWEKEVASSEVWLCFLPDWTHKPPLPCDC